MKRALIGIIIYLFKGPRQHWHRGGMGIGYYKNNHFCQSLITNYKEVTMESIKRTFCDFYRPVMISVFMVVMFGIISNATFGDKIATAKEAKFKAGVQNFGLLLQDSVYTRRQLLKAMREQDFSELEGVADLTANSPNEPLETTDSSQDSVARSNDFSFGSPGQSLAFIRTPEQIANAGCSIPLGDPTTGADATIAYFGPPPTTVNRFLIGQTQLLTAGEVDINERTITLPLYRGELRNGKNVWYIVTDTTDEGNAEALGLNFSAKLVYSDVDRGAREATLKADGTLVFEEGRVDFSPERNVVPSSTTFPPATAEPGSIGNSRYSPLVKITNAGGHIYNAPMVAFDVSAEEIDFPNGNVDHSILHDSVVAVDIEAQTVTLELTLGFSFGRPVFYLSTDAFPALPAALEGATLAPGLASIETGNDDSLFSAVERIFLFINGSEGCNNPQRQGLIAAINDGNTPFNVLGGIPTIATDYSPLWDINLGEWTQEAIDNGYRSRMIGEFQILFNVENGFITGPNGEDYGSIGAIVNCPIVSRLL